MAIRAVFLGNDPWSVPTLDALARAPDVDVVLVVTNPPRPAGRGSKLRSTVVADSARGQGLPLLEVEGIRAHEGRAGIEAARPDAIVVVAYGEILPPELVDLPSLGAVNVHFSLLPRWRGAAPVQRAILEGDQMTGITVMLMDNGLDTGPTLARREETIGLEEDAGSLGARLASLGAPMLVNALRALEAGTATPEPQDPGAATYAAKLLPGERELVWSAPADAVVRRVRAFAPEPGAVTTFRGKSLRVLRAHPEPKARIDANPTQPGQLGVGPDGVPVVEAREGGVVLLEVGPAGRKQMTGVDWARGARLEPGDRLG